MTNFLQIILKEIKEVKNPVSYLRRLDRISADPKAFYIADVTSQTFGELPLDIVPQDLADRFIKAYVDLAIELLSSNHEKFEDCPSWNKYSEVGDELANEIRKYPSPYDY